MIKIAQSVNVLVICDVLVTLRAHLLKLLAVAGNTEEAFLHPHSLSFATHVSHAEIVLSQLLSALTTIETSIVVVATSYLDCDTEEYRIAVIAKTVYLRRFLHS